MDNPKLTRWMADAIEKVLPGFTHELYREAARQAHEARARFWASHPAAGPPGYVLPKEEPEP